MSLLSCSRFSSACKPCVWGYPNGDLRHKRILAHRALKKLQQDCHMEKWEVYIWLQAKLGLDAHQTHIGQFSEYMCEQVISLCQQAPAYTSGRAA